MPVDRRPMRVFYHEPSTSRRDIDIDDITHLQGDAGSPTETTSITLVLVHEEAYILEAGFTGARN